MINIAIDGPSGAGKSTIAKQLAKDLNYIYLDTGAMYRAVAYAVNKQGIDVNDSAKVCAYLPNIKIDIQYKEGMQYIWANDEDVTLKIREHHMSQLASDVSKIPEVRIKLVEMQREFAKSHNIILDGRDITSYVLPNADYKFYLTASAEVRAKRRHEELISKGQILDYSKVLEDIIKRDKNDMERDFAPLTQTEDSILIDSSNLTLKEVINKIKKHIKED